MEPHLRYLLNPYFEVVIDEENPDLIFHEYKHFVDSLKYSCPKILLTGENRLPDFTLSDYSFSFAPNSDKNFQITLVSVYYDPRTFSGFMQNRLPDEIKQYQDKPKLKFCNFIYSNEKFPSGAVFRKKFAQALMRYRKVDCSSSVLRNTPPYDRSACPQELRREHLDFLSDYKFTIAFENSSSPGYVTEKIYHPLLVGSIPIYWGAEDIEDYFNPRCFINCHRFKTFDEVICKIREIDNDPELYQSYFQESPLLSNSKMYNSTHDKLSAQLFKVITELLKPDYKAVYRGNESKRFFRKSRELPSDWYAKHLQRPGRPITLSEGGQSGEVKPGA